MGFPATVSANSSLHGIYIDTGTTHERFLVELANTPETRKKGLMGREKLADRHGMLFVTNAPTNIRMWMKDTPLSLDMLFIDATHTIVYIHPNTTPFSTEAISANQNVIAVLELKAGTALQYGITTGMKMHADIL